MPLTGIAGSLALVTGAAQGIGEGVARALAAAGARLALIDRAAEPLAAITRSLERERVAVWTAAVDITDAEAVARAVADAEARMGPIDSLVNVAGILRLAPLVDLSVADFAATLAVNLTGTFVVTQAVARRMVARRAGAIVTVSSNAARVPRLRQGAYCASKAGVSHLMRVFALELAPYGIRCNTVAPGATETAMIRRMMESMGFGEEVRTGNLAAFRVGVPLGAVAQVADVANAVLFLLSKEAGQVTMHELVVDGGAALGA
jgi:2,3-dihydro-2,3-dihydroxybenzoate dehydrogenase